MKINFLVGYSRKDGQDSLSITLPKDKAESMAKKDCG